MKKKDGKKKKDEIQRETRQSTYRYTEKKMKRPKRDDKVINGRQTQQNMRNEKKYGMAVYVSERKYRTTTGWYSKYGVEMALHKSVFKSPLNLFSQVCSPMSDYVSWQ